MRKIIDRYSGAVHSGNLGSKPDTTHSDSDVLGAFGLAAKRSPLAVALARLFTGDNHAAGHIVTILAEKVISRAYSQGITLAHVEAQDLSRAVLSWQRDSRCKSCGGHGVRVILGTTTLGDEPCPVCKGEGRIPFNRQFTMERLELARWLSTKLEAEIGVAGEAAMRMLAPRLDL